MGGSLLSCSEPPFEPEETRISDDEAQRLADQARAEVSGAFAGALDVSLWASDTLMGDPIALDIDDQGRVLITVTNRRYTAEVDVRDHPDWQIPTLRFANVDDRAAFLRETLSADRSAENSDWLDDANGDGVHDWRDLTVEKEEVYQLDDVTGNGLANRSRLFYRGVNDLTADVAGAVLRHDGDVFVGVAPDLWRLRDTDGDEIADTKTSISHGYKVHFAFGGHGMSGLTVGPYGRLYWSIGDQGLNVTDAGGNQWAYPHQGAILRADPDGSNFEVFAGGLRNTHEFVFDAYGNLIGVDNDGDHAGEFERLIHLIDGSDSGWRIHWQFGKYADPKNNEYKPWMDENYFRPRPEHQGAHILPPLAPYHPPAGMAYNPGTALGAPWKDHFFVARFTGSPSGSGVDAFTLEPNGSSFELEESERVLQGIQVTGMDFGPDGALYLADWVEGWAPNEEGRIWRMDVPDDEHAALREETRMLLQSAFADRSAEELVDLLGHADQRVRMKAQFALAEREALDAFRTAITADEQLRRIHGIWGIAQLGRADSARMQALLEWHDDEDPEIRAQVARALGDVRYAPAADVLMEHIDDEAPRARLFAAQALGRIGHEPAFDALVELIATNDNADAHLHHAGIIALARVGDGEALGALADHPSQSVRLAAVVALKRLEDPVVARFLDDDDTTVVTNAARAINDDAFIEDALPALAEMLDREPAGSEPLVRRAINASLYSGRSADAQRLARFAERPAVDDALRAEALHTLARWADPSMLDRVTGRYRGPVDNEIEPARRAIASVTPALLKASSAAVREAAVEAIRETDYREATEALVRLVEADASPAVRMAALTALRDLEYASAESIFRTALNDENQSVREAALDMIPDLALPETDIVALLASVLEQGTTEEQQAALETLGTMDDEAATELLAKQMDRLLDGALPRALELELLEAAEQSDAEALTTRLEAYRSTLSEGDTVDAYRAALYGGAAERGEEIFYQHPSAQCTRCHAISGADSPVGPALAGVGAQLSREQLLEALVDPDARLAPGYGGVTLTLEDGSTLRGIVEAESDASITLRMGEDQVRTLSQSEVTDRVQSSPMPPMGNVLSRSQLRDLVAYLATLKDAS
jgi:putative heme-binding domain-containing protein